MLLSSLIFGKLGPPNWGNVMFHRRLLFVAISAATTLITAAAAQAPGRWTNGAPMPSSRTEVAVAELGGKIYVVGGFSGEREIEIYDPAVDRWSRGAAFPHEVHHAAAVGLNGRLYVIGGYVQGWTPTNAVYEYDPGSDRWRMLAPMPTSRGALGSAVLAGKIHAVSGVGAGGKNTPAECTTRPPMCGQYVNHSRRRAII